MSILTTLPRAASEADADASVVGKWKVVRLEGTLAKQGGIADDLKTQTVDLHADHTYRRFSSAIGGISGTWAVEGQKIVLTTSDDATDLATKKTYMEICGSELTSGDDELRSIYDRMPADADKPKFSLDAKSLLAEMKKDKAAAVKKYAGNVVEVEGLVGDIRVDYGGDCSVTIAGPDPGDQSFMSSSITCFMIDRQTFARLGPNQKVKIRGQAHDQYGDLAIIESEIVETGPATIITTTAAELAGDAARGPTAPSHWCIISTAKAELEFRCWRSDFADTRSARPAGEAGGGLQGET